MNPLTLIVDNLIGLIQNQHALYPHLVPMQRDIHRTKPRVINFKAIRWVNPHRYYPLMSLTDNEIETLSAGQFRKYINEINKYRKMATVIHNRYNQQLGLIAQGLTPYPILWKEDKWMSLADREKRANDLKKGTMDWEQQIDKRAALVRQKMGQKHGLKLDDIDSLWEDGNIPAFKDPKKGRDTEGYKKYLRTTRDRKRIRSEPRVDEQAMRTPAPESRRSYDVYQTPDGKPVHVTHGEGDGEREVAGGGTVEVRDGQAIYHAPDSAEPIPVTDTGEQASETLRPYTPTPGEMEETMERPTRLDELMIHGPLSTDEEAAHLSEPLKILRHQRIGDNVRQAESDQLEEEIIENAKTDGKGTYMKYSFDHLDSLVPQMGQKINWRVKNTQRMVNDKEDITQEDIEVQKEWAERFGQVSQITFHDNGSYGVTEKDGKEVLVNSPQNGITTTEHPSDIGTFQAISNASQMQRVLGMNVMAPTEVVDRGDNFREQGFQHRFVTYEDTVRGVSALDMDENNWSEALQQPEARQSLMAIALNDAATSRQNKRNSNNVVFTGNRFFAVGNHTQFNAGDTKEIFSLDTNFPQLDAWPGNPEDYQQEVEQFIDKYLTDNLNSDSIRKMLTPEGAGGLGLRPPQRPPTTESLVNYVMNMIKGG